MLKHGAAWLRSCTVFVIFLLSAHLLPAQPRHDNIWILGYAPNDSALGFGGTLLRLDSGYAATNFFNINCDFRASNVTFSDSTGNLIFYANGCSIFNKVHTVMDNGDTLNPGYIFNNYCEEEDGYLGQQSMIAIPLPDNDSLVYLFHLWTSNGDISDALWYSLVDIKANSGLGKVVEKNEIAISSYPMATGYVCAVRHGNGRDWWIFVPQNANNKYYRLLLTPEGIASVQEQAIGYAWDEIDWSSQACFSPDGAKYARFDWKHGLHIFDFERCSGLLSNPVHITFPNEEFYTAGVAISPNSRYLYAAAEIKLYQFDLWASDVAASRILIAGYDGQPFPYFGSFYFAQLAADGRIYIAPAGSHQHLHIIDQPDKPGVACKFQQHGLPLPTFNFTAIPNFPNFKLGSLDASSCDTLGIDNHPVARFRYEMEDTLSPSQVSFIDLSYYAPTTWNWDFGDGTASQDTNPIHTFLSTGVFDVCLIVSNENSADTFCQNLQINTVGTQDLSVPLKVQVVPNPFGSWLRVSFPVLITEKPEFRLFDIFGQVVLSMRLQDFETILDLPYLPSGVYTWQVLIQNTMIQTGKIIRVE